MKENNIKLFKGRKIRTKWEEEIQDYYYSIIDVIAVLTESKDPNAYWRKLKQKLKEEGNQTVTNCHQLKMPAKDGKMRMTDVATTKQLLRPIQSAHHQMRNHCRKCSPRTGSKHWKKSNQQKQCQR